MVGTTLGKRYEIQSQLGEGGMAVVYLGKDLLLGRAIAIKALRPQYAADKDFVERFRREAQSAASLSHPNVVHIFDVGTDGDIHYIVMEYIEGRNLKDLLRERGALPAAEAVYVAKEVCRALDAAHRRHVVHRDIKPHNILVTRDGQVKVTDFGIARAASSATLTQAGTMLGSVHYLSPEQATERRVGSFSDVYSVGVLLYEMVTGRLPFEAESPVAVALKHLHDDPPAPGRIVRDLPARLEAVILRAMAKEPAARYKDAGEMLRELSHLAAASPDDWSDLAVSATRTGYAGQRPTAQPESKESATDTRSGPEGDAGAAQGSEDSERTIVRTSKQERPDDREVPTKLTITEEEHTRVARKPKRRTRRRVWVGIVVLLCFLSGVVWAAGRLPEIIFPPEVVVPNLQGQAVDEARELLRAQGLELRIEREVNSDQPVNTVVHQEPQAERRVRMGRTIQVRVSIGREIVEVPDLAHLSEREAGLRLMQNGLEVGEVHPEFRADLAPNLVIRQEPPPFARVQRGSAVSFVLSTGAVPVATVRVPDLVGTRLEDAIAEVEGLGLVVGETFPEEDPRFEPGQVTDQEPPAGAEVEVGSVVQFVYRRTQAQVAPPSGAPRGTAPDESLDDGEIWVRALINITVPPGPEQDVEILVIDNISARHVYKRTHRGDSRIFEIIAGRGPDAMYQVWIGGELIVEGLVREAQ